MDRFVCRVLDAASVDIRSLAAFRIAFALVFLADLWWRAPDISFFYTDSGSLSRSEAIFAASPWAISLNFLNGTWQFQAVLFALAAAAGAALLLGYRTQLVMVITWLFIMSIHRRNPQVLQGGDNLLRCLAFWAMFVPLGAVWSLDSRRNLHRQEATKLCSLPALFLQLQIVAMYFFASLLKTGVPWRAAHSAVYYALSIDPLTTPFGRSLLPNRQLLSLLTIGTIKLERFGAFLVFIPFFNTAFRLLAVLLFGSFHIGLLLAMNLGPFPFVCLTAWLVFLPSAFWDYLTGAEKISWLDWRESCFVVHGSRFFIAVRDTALFFFFVAAILWNIRTLDPAKGAKFYSADYNYILVLVGLDQNWGMFSPYPMNGDGWWQIVGRTDSGRTVNLSPGAAPDDPITDDRPARIDLMYRTERWRKYMMFLAEKQNSAWLGAFARGLMSDWSASHPDDMLKHIDMYFWFELTQDEGSTPAQKTYLWYYDR